MRKEDKDIIDFKKRVISQDPDTEIGEDIRKELIEEEETGIHRSDIIGKNEFILQEKYREELRKNYFDNIDVLKTYIDMKEDYYPIVSCWIIGTYFHEKFKSFPYLFFNAMRGSGKTKILSLIAELSKDGSLMTSPTEAVLFRTNGTLAIDEFERIGSKEKASIRELLNACYKSGVKVFRMKKKKVDGQEEQVVEEFKPYRPLLMANIYGMDEILGDRCIQLVLEKSDDDIITRLSEDWDNNEMIKEIKNRVGSVGKCRLCSQKYLYREWDNYLHSRYGNSIQLHTQPTYHTYNNNNIYNNNNNTHNNSVGGSVGCVGDDLTPFFNKVVESGIKGRNLELFLPLFIIARIIGDIDLVNIIKIAKDLIKDKDKDEEVESRDIMVFDFISQLDNYKLRSVKELTIEFTNFLGEEHDYMDSAAFGKALKRLNLVLDKRRVYRGVEVTLNIKKAQQKMKMFRK